MRDKIRTEVLSIEPLDDHEASTIRQVIQWIDSGVELCRIKKPDVPNQHLVSYFIVVDNEYVLLVDHINAELWLPTGGHVEPEEHPRDTVLREAREELNIKAEFLYHKPLFITCTETVGKTSGHNDVSIWYVLKGNQKMALSFDKIEFHSVRWFHKDDIPLRRTDPEMQRFLKKLYPRSSV